jgi:hypothetical protein
MSGFLEYGSQDTTTTHQAHLEVIIYRMAGFMRKANGEEITQESETQSVAESLPQQAQTNHIRGDTFVARRSIIDIGGSGLFYIVTRECRCMVV